MNDISGDVLYQTCSKILFEAQSTFLFNSFASLDYQSDELESFESIDNMKSGGDCYFLSHHLQKLLLKENISSRIYVCYSLDSNTQRSQNPFHSAVFVPFYHTITKDSGVIFMDIGLHIPIPVLFRDFNFSSISTKFAPMSHSSMKSHGCAFYENCYVELNRVGDEYYFFKWSITTTTKQMYPGSLPNVFCDQNSTTSQLVAFSRIQDPNEKLLAISKYSKGSLLWRLKIQRPWKPDWKKRAEFFYSAKNGKESKEVGWDSIKSLQDCHDIFNDQSLKFDDFCKLVESKLPK